MMKTQNIESRRYRTGEYTVCWPGTFTGGGTERVKLIIEHAHLIVSILYSLLIYSEILSNSIGCLFKNETKKEETNERKKCFERKNETYN